MGGGTEMVPTLCIAKLTPYLIVNHSDDAGIGDANPLLSLGLIGKLRGTLVTM